MSGTSSKSRATAFAPRIDHARFRKMKVHDLRELIRYPPSKRRYEGNERIEAVRTCLYERATDDKRLAIFAHCLSRDPRMSVHVKNFASNAISKSIELIDAKKRRLETVKGVWEMHDRILRDMKGNRTVKKRGTSRYDWIRNAERRAIEIKETSLREVDAMPEWDAVEHDAYAFDQRLDEEIAAHTTLVLMKGVNKMPLTRNAKRLVFDEMLKVSGLKRKRTPNAAGSSAGSSA